MVAHEPHAPGHKGELSAPHSEPADAALVTQTYDRTITQPDCDTPLDPTACRPAPPVTEIVQRIHEGALAAADLDPALRRQCVVHLTARGFATTEIAELLAITDRTVRRDREAIRKEEALEPSLTLGDELLGEFQRLASASVQRLTRMAADHSAPAFARLWAEDAIARIYQRFIETLRRLGYIETGGTRLRKLSATGRTAAARLRAALPHSPEFADIGERG
jgi:hypothetical protein